MTCNLLSDVAHTDVGVRAHRCWCARVCRGSGWRSGHWGNLWIVGNFIGHSGTRVPQESVPDISRLLCHWLLVLFFRAHTAGSEQTACAAVIRWTRPGWQSLWCDYWRIESHCLTLSAQCWLIVWWIVFLITTLLFCSTSWLGSIV